jgi:hypothetical protein
VKCASSLDMLLGSILIVIVSHVILFTLSVAFRYDFRLPNPVLRVNSLPIAMWS